jgi:hypothetical protein
MKRPTPCFDKWIEAVEPKLTPRGVKANLARYLSKRYGRPARSWESNLGQIIARNLLPNAEILLAIEEWLAAFARPKKGRRELPFLESVFSFAESRPCEDIHSQMQ